MRETPDALWKELERTEVVLGELSAENEDLVQVRGDARERWRAAAKAVER